MKRKHARSSHDNFDADRSRRAVGARAVVALAVLALVATLAVNHRTPDADVADGLAPERFEAPAIADELVRERVALGPVRPSGVG